MHIIVTALSITWALSWAATLWTSLNLITGTIIHLKNEGLSRAEAKALVLHRRLSALGWAILIVFWFN